jgi:hypothetical protein
MERCLREERGSFGVICTMLSLSGKERKDPGNAGEKEVKVQVWLGLQIE